MRVLGPEDASEFMRLRLEALIACPTAFASSLAEEAETPLHEIEARFSMRADGVVIGAFDGSRLVGMCGIQRERLLKLAHKATVWGMYVDPRVRRQGVGGGLIQAVVAHAKAILGVRTVRLGVNAENRAAIALYEKAGFEITGTEIGYMMVDGRLYDERQMAKPLTDIPRF